MSQPVDSSAHQLAAEFSEQLNMALTELGMDISDLYQMSRADQLQLIEQVTDKALNDQTIGELARLAEQENLTGAEERANLNVSDKMRFGTPDAKQQYKSLQKLGLMRLPSFAEFIDMQSNNSLEYQKLICRYQNLTGVRPWSAVEFNPEKLNDHFVRHKSGVDAATEQEYAYMAIDFVNSTTGNVSFADYNGVRRFFNEETGLFAAVYPDGTISTFFKPSNPANYWKGQVNKYD